MTADPQDALARAVATLAASRRDAAAWEVLYRELRPFVFATAYRRLGSVQGLAEDATQEVFARLMRSCPFDRLADPDRLRGYVWRVSDNVARRYRAQLLRLGSSSDAEPIEDPASAGAHAGVELAHLLRQVWTGLSDAERRMLRLLLDEEPLPAMAAALGISYGAAAVRLVRLRRKLRSSAAFAGMLLGRRSM